MTWVLPGWSNFYRLVQLLSASPTAERPAIEGGPGAAAGATSDLVHVRPDFDATTVGNVPGHVLDAAVSREVVCVFVMMQAHAVGITGAGFDVRPVGPPIIIFLD